MWDLIHNIAYAVLMGVVQLVIGSIISIPVYRVGVYLKGSPVKGVAVIGISAMLGMLLPMHIYGIIPIAAALLAAGFSFAEVMPMLITNTLFNMSVPYTDPMFIWKTGINRVALAYAAGAFGGILLNRFNRPERLLRWDNVRMFGEENTLLRWSKVPKLIENNILGAGAFLLIGAGLNALFYGYILWPVLQFIYTDSSTSFIPIYFAGLDVVNPFFLQTMNIMHMLMNLVILSGLFVLVKPRGVLLYIAYYVLLAVLLGTSAFF